MKFTILEVMTEVIPDKAGILHVQPSQDIHSNMKLVSGKNAGVCYMKDSYFGSAVTDEEKALKRCDNVWSNGHHSVSGHERVKVLLDEIPKALAMLLNNLQNYDTSEKSGRYTEMQGSTQLEQSMYNKWREIFSRVIADKVPSINEKKREKLAMENARYFLSIFSPSTTMVYTTSIREWNYIIDWIDKFRDEIRLKDLTDFETKFHFDAKLLESLTWLEEEIKSSIIYFPELRDIKKYEFHTFHEDYLFSSEDLQKESSVTTMGTFFRKGKASFAMLAQLQRHRTGRVQMMVENLDGENLQVFVPKILDADLAAKWKSDMKVMLDNGILVTGYLVKFAYTVALDKLVLMLKERLCGSAQLEIRNFAIDVTRWIGEKLKAEPNTVCDAKTREFFLRALDENNRVVARKCQYIKCNNPCSYAKSLPNADRI